MIYLDYAATTPVDPRVLDVFCRAAIQQYGNANSLHRLGVEAKMIINDASESILKLLGVPSREVIYASGASEANNLAIKGLAAKKATIGKHVITSPFEHPSVTASFGILQNQGFEVDFAPLGLSGLIDVDRLEEMLRDDTILVSIAKVNSETGIIQPVEAIGRMLRRHPYITFHSDLTQAVGKIPVDLSDIGLATFSAHKFYGLKGIGALVRREDILIESQISGGKSTTLFRSGTPSLPLIVSLEEALRIAILNLDDRYRKVFGLNIMLRERLQNIPNVVLNSPLNGVPQIINFSVLSRDADTMLKMMDIADICVSTQTACHTGGTRSETIFRLTGDERRALSSLRVSLSHLTTQTEIEALLDVVENGA